MLEPYPGHCCETRTICNFSWTLHRFLSGHLNVHSLSTYLCACNLLFPSFAMISLLSLSAYWYRPSAHVAPVASSTKFTLLAVGISGGCASMRNVPNLRNTGTLLIFIVFVRSSGLQAPLNIYLLSFCSLQYIYEDYVP